MILEKNLHEKILAVEVHLWHWRNKKMKICPKCDAEVNEKFQFCGVCGARLPDADDEDFTSLESNDYYTESDSFFNADTIKNYW